MSQSSDAILFYGMLLDLEEEELAIPWLAEDGDYWDIEEWWLKLHAPDWESGIEIYNAEGNHLRGVTEAMKERYYAARQVAEAALPALPVEVVIHCSESFPEYALAIPGTVTTANRGYPESIDPCRMMSMEEYAAANTREAWVEFIRVHLGIDRPIARWYLVSYAEL